MAAWGNALGGWRKQSRKKNGQFGKGGVSSKAKSKAKPKSKTKKSKAKKKVSRIEPSKKRRSKAAVWHEKQKYQDRHYRAKAGGIAKEADDWTHSRGAHSVNRYGQEKHKAIRVSNRIVGSTRHLSPQYLSSKTRGKIYNGGKGRGKPSKKRQAAAFAAGTAVLATGYVAVQSGKLGVQLAADPEFRKVFDQTVGVMANQAFQQAREAKIGKMQAAARTADFARSHGISTFKPAKYNRRTQVYNITTAKKPRRGYR